MNALEAEKAAAERRAAALEAGRADLEASPRNEYLTTFCQGDCEPE